MAVAPALGVMLLTDFSANILFLTSMVVTLLSAVSAKLCNAKEAPLPAEKKSISIRHKICEYGTGIPSILTVLFGCCLW